MAACLAQWRHLIVECDDAGLQDQVRDIETVSRMLHSVMLEAVAELESRSIAASTGFGTTRRLLAGMLHLSATEARTRVTHATQIAARRTLSGEPLAPGLPNTAAALAAGEIGPAQVRVIAETMNAIPASVSITDREAAEADLTRHARSFDPTSLHKIGRHILAHLDPDGPRPRDDHELAAAAEELRLWERRDGRLGLEGFLEPEHCAAFRSLIEQLAAPRPAVDAIPDARTTHSATPTPCWRSAGWPAPPGTAPPPPGKPHTSPSPSTGTPCAPASGPRPSTTGHTSAHRRPDGGHATRKLSPSSWAGHPSHSMSGEPCGPFRCPFAERSSRGTADALSRAATGHRECVKLTTASTGSTPATPVWKTAFFYARRITATCTAPAGKSSSTLTTSTSFHQRSLIRPAPHCAGDRR
jgi:Domain of unknown function (DUF222)